MCGRAKLPDDVSELKLDLKIDWDEIRAYQPQWNATPTSKLPVVVAQDGQRTLTLMRWGLVPSRAKNLKVGRSTFNARAEGIDTRTAFRAAWRAGRRCLVIADAYYEWRKKDGQPFAIGLSNRGPMTLAGLWDSWTAPNGEAIKSFTIITTTANALLQPLHERMPVLLTAENWAIWLGETAASDADLKALLKPYPGAMAFWPVERRTGNAHNDTADLDSADLFAPHAREERASPGVVTCRQPGRQE